MIISNIVYLIAFIFLVLWILGYLIYNIGSSVHVLLVISIFLFALRFIKVKNMITK